MVNPHTLLLVHKGAPQKHSNILFFQLAQFKHNGAGNQSFVYLIVRIFRSCANEDYGSILHMRQKCVLLTFIKTVYLVNKQYSLFAVHSQIRPRVFYCFLNVLHAGRRGVQLMECAFRCIRDDFRQRRLPCSRRAIKNNRTEAVALNRAIKQPVLPYDMLLPYKFLQRSRTHTGCKRTVRPAPQASVIFK